MHWVIQNDIFKEDGWNSMVETLDRFNIPYSVHKVVPFVGDLIPEPVIEHKNVICFGSYSMRHYAKKMGWNPGVFDLEPFDFTVQKHHWGEHMLNHDAVVSRFEDAVFTQDQMFIRPIHDTKVFAGKLMDRQEFVDWQKRVCVLKLDYGNSLTNDTLVQVCRPKTIFSEHRFWIVSGRIVTASTYKIGWNIHYQPCIDQRFHQFVYDILNTKNQRRRITLSVDTTGWLPHEAFVIDVADTEQGLKVVEINTLNSSGFYAGDMQKLVMTLNETFNQR